MTNLKSKIAKAGLGLLAGAVMFAGVTVSAMTQSQAQALVASLGITGASATALVTALTTESSTGSTMTSTSCYSFNTALMLGSKGADVMNLQKVLNSDANTMVAMSGAGSKGNETSTFGPATKAAVIKYQMAHNITPASGRVGPLTMATLNKCTTTGGTTTGGTTTDGTTTTGPVTAMLSSDTPNGTTILSGQALADLAHFTFSGNGTVTSVTLQRTGLSASADISNVYLFDGNMRLTDGASINTNGTIVFNGLNIAVNGSKMISVKADIASGSISSVSLGVTMTGFMTSGATAMTTTNAAGNVLYVSTGTGLTATAALGVNSVTSGQTYNINAGSLQYTVWSAPLTVSTRAVWLKGANFRVVGSAPTDAVQNLKMYVDGAQVGSAISVGSNNYAFFDFGSSPVNLTTGSHTIDIRGDIQKGSNRTVQFSIQNAADLLLVDSQLGINIAAGNTGGSSFMGNAMAGTISINTGSVTTVIDPTFQSMTNITGGATNTVIGRFKMHAYGEDVKVQTLAVVPMVTSATAAGSAATTTLNNVTLFVNGSQVGSSQNWNAAAITAGSLTYNLGSSMILPAGVDTTVEVRADLVTSDSYNYSAGTVVAKLNLGANNGQGMSSLSASINVPSSNIQTSGLSVQTGQLTVGKNSAYTNQTLNPNTTHALLASFILQNQSSSESVRVTNYQVNLGLTTIGSTNISNLSTDETSGSGSTPINPATIAASTGFSGTSTNNFSVNFTLAPGATKTVNVYGDLSTAATGSVVTTLLPTALGVSSNVVVTPAVAYGQTIALGAGTFNTPTVVSSNTTQTQFVSGGTTTGVSNATKTEFNVTATNGTATISELKFKNTASSGAVTAVTVGGATAPTVSDVAYLTGLNITVPNGGAGFNLDALASYAPVGSTGVSSGSLANLVLCYVKYSIGGTTSTYGTTDCSSGTISSGQTMTLVGSKPTVTVSQPSSVVLTAGNVEAIDVTVSADAAGPITMVSFPITSTISPSGTFSTGTANAFIVKDANNNVVAVNTTSNFSATAGGTATVTFTTPRLIGAGNSETYKVFLPVATLGGTGTVPNTYMYSNLATGANFVWRDTAGQIGSTTVDVTGTTKIYNFPSTFTSSVHN